MPPSLRPRAVQRNQEGFTLLELMVSLAAGLIVSMAVMAVATTVNRNVHQDYRASDRDMALEDAMLRLRSDVQRAAFMSTSNIQLQPTDWAMAGGAGPSLSVMNRLAGIYLNPEAGFAGATAPALLTTVNGIPKPDLLEMGGNFTSVDDFFVESFDVLTGKVVLSKDSPAIKRLFNQVLGDVQKIRILRSLFQPGRPESGTSAALYMARLHYLSTDCSYFYILDESNSGTDAITMDSGRPVLQLKVRSIIPKTSSAGRSNGCASGPSLHDTDRTLNPVQWVRWFFRKTPDPAPDAPSDAYADLVRQYVDAAGDPIVGSLEVIVPKVAVTLKVGVTANTADPPPDSTTDEVKLRYVEPGAGSAADLKKYAGRLRNLVGTTYQPSDPEAWPNRAKALTLELWTRSGGVDASKKWDLDDGGTTVNYCTEATASSKDTCKTFARVRQSRLDVTLANQARYSHQW